MKQRTLIFALLGLIALLFAGCATQGESTAVADAVSTATPEGEGWVFQLVGVRSDELWQSDVLSWAEIDDSYGEIELDFRGENRQYTGLPLSAVIAMVDDADGGMPYLFQEDLWIEGYDITLTAKDGYSYTFNTADFAPDAIYLVDHLDGQETAPGVAGGLPGSGWVQDLASIELSLAPVALAENNFELVLDIAGTSVSYTIPELEAMSLYVEDRGSYTNSYGNTFAAEYGGVLFLPLIEQYMDVTADSALKIIAMDGYEMNYGGEMFLDESDGRWILAFKENGEYMPEDPGYIRLVKVGPDEPNIDGHASARMIKSIVSEAQPFVDFSLTIVEDGIEEVFDRQNMQSGVVTNRNRVVYYDRRADEDIEFMGISLWRLLERLEGYSAVTIEATDGFSVTLDNMEIEGNDGVIIAMYSGENDELLGSDDWPLRLVWDKDAEVVPEGIKSVRNVVKIILEY